MKAAILRAGRMVVDQIDNPIPGPGQVLVRTIACGICGSDLHTVGHAHDLVATAKAANGDLFDFDPDQDLVMGHELAVEVLALGKGVQGVSEGHSYAAMPFVATPQGRRVPGYDNHYPGGYAEQMLLSPHALLRVPNGLEPKLAALTEPMAVGLHAVNRSSVSPNQAAIVVGAGPVGLAIVGALSAMGAGPIIAADFSPTRRQVALSMGADCAIDPTETSVFDRWSELASGADTPVVFEAVGVPGMIDQIMTEAPPHSEIVVVGVCMGVDSFRPTMGIYKHLRLTFVLGWSPEEFATSLANLAEGRIDPSALVTGQIGIDQVPKTFEDLADPELHVKILVCPDT